MIARWRPHLFVFLVFLLSISVISFLNSAKKIKSGLRAVKNHLTHSLPLSSSSTHDNPPEKPPFGAVVAAAQYGTDLDWMNNFKQNWLTYAYDVNNPKNDDPRLRFPMSKGHEAMIYLTYIIESYDSLPWCVIFVHGHREAWHQEDTIEHLLSDLNHTALANVGYINLRCDWYPSCPAEIRPVTHDAKAWGPGVLRKESEVAIAGNWKQLFPGIGLPETIASQCCAQFAVTRRAILQRPKSDYERMREWLIGTLLVDDVSGRVFEKLWAYIFTGEAVHCPPPQTCSCEFFGRCEPRMWNEFPDNNANP